MGGALQTAGDDAPRCVDCGAEAAGPCMRCRCLLCGDCCVLTEGGASVYALCRRCGRGEGRSLTGRWRGVGGLLLLVLLGLVALNVAVSLLAGR